MADSFFLGIELGSTRIKAVVIDEGNLPIATATHAWENRLEDGYWTYHLEDLWVGVQEVVQLLGNLIPLGKITALGISAMMHGYLAFDAEDKQLVSFRTWRNTNTAKAAQDLSSTFSFNIPQRWSIAHLYQAILDKEEHVSSIAWLTTLAGYVHYKLSGEKVLGIGDASGMFPIDSTTCFYDATMVTKFEELAQNSEFNKKLTELLPKPLLAGVVAGSLTPQGALLLDPKGRIKADIPLSPPEGDAGTGMVATNSVASLSCNLSAGTSIFAMAVLESPLSTFYEEIDMVTTPSGLPVAMVHCNNCTSDLDAWIRLFAEMISAVGIKIEASQLYSAFYKEALLGATDAGGLLAYNFLSGEPIVGLAEGRPLMVRLPESELNLANFARCQLYAALATLKLGMDILYYKEDLRLSILTGHGGLFVQPVTGPQLVAAALEIPVAVTPLADEGGAWGIALLVSFMMQKEPHESLEQFLETRIFAKTAVSHFEPRFEDVEGFKVFMERYNSGLSIAKKAVEALER